MNEDALEKALRYSEDHVKALSSASDALRDAIGCVVCNCIMVEPYALRCGHTFCGKCLQSWTRERAENSTCPTCRAPIESKPVFCLALRQLALVVIASYNADLDTTEKIPGESLELSESPSFFNNNTTGIPIFDSEDQIYRCPHCSHEIEDDGRCSGCDAYFLSRDRYENGETDDSWEESSQGPGGNNRDRMPLTGHDEGNTQSVVSHSNLLRGFVNLGSSLVGSDSDGGEDDMGSFIDDDEEHFGSSCDGSAEEVDLWADNDDDEDISKDNEAEETSDDSLLQETRGNMNDESDLEVTGVRHRTIIMDDDD